jgi:cyanate permease
VIEYRGWQAGFLLLAAFSALSIPLTLLLLQSRDEQVPKLPAHLSNAEFAAIWRQRLFWLQASAFATMAFTFFGTMVQFVPMLRDGGLTNSAAAGYVSLLGGAVIFSRVLIGWLADMVHAPWLAVVTCALAGLACLAMVSGESAFYPFVAISIGAAVGAETDLLGYLTARYFGLRVYGRVYAWQYGIFIFAAGSSPAWVGFIRDRTGSYSAGLLISCGASLVSIVLFCLLPRYQQSASEETEPELA